MAGVMYPSAIHSTGISDMASTNKRKRDDNEGSEGKEEPELDTRQQICKKCELAWPWIIFSRKPDGSRDVDEEICLRCLGQEGLKWKLNMIQINDTIARARRRWIRKSSNTRPVPVPVYTIPSSPQETTEHGPSTAALVTPSTITLEQPTTVVSRPVLSQQGEGGGSNMIQLPPNPNLNTNLQLQPNGQGNPSTAPTTNAISRQAMSIVNELRASPSAGQSTVTTQSGPSGSLNQGTVLHRQPPLSQVQSRPQHQAQSRPPTPMQQPRPPPVHQRLQTQPPRSAPVQARPLPQLQPQVSYQRPPLPPQQRLQPQSQVSRPPQSHPPTYSQILSGAQALPDARHQNAPGAQNQGYVQMGQGEGHNYHSNPTAYTHSNTMTSMSAGTQSRYQPSDPWTQFYSLPEPTRAMQWVFMNYEPSPIAPPLPQVDLFIHYQSSIPHAGFPALMTGKDFIMTTARQYAQQGVRLDKSKFCIDGLGRRAQPFRFM